MRFAMRGWVMMETIFAALIQTFRVFRGFKKRVERLPAF